jgi:predicted GNAT family acetyltransferase
MNDSPDDLRVEPDEDGSRGRFKLLGGEGQLLGQMTFSRARDDLIIVDHTEVDDSLQGKGGGSRLFNAMVAWARDSGTQVMTTCPFTQAMFERNPDSRDVLIPT